MFELIQKIKNKNAKELTLREASILVRHNELTRTGIEQEEVYAQLQAELDVATNASSSNVTTVATKGGDFVPASVMIGTLIDLSDETEDYSFMSAFTPFHQVLASRTTVVPVLGKTGKAIVKSEQATDAQFRVAKDSLQSVNSDKVSITAKKLYNNAQISDELSTFSIVELEALMLGRVRSGILMSMADVVINADDTTGTTSNVNTAADVSGLADYATNPLYNYGKGLRAIGLAGGATSSLDIGAVTGSDDIIDLQALVTSTRNPARKLIIMDAQTYYAMMKKEDFKDAAKNGRNSTIYSGSLTNIAGSDLFVTGLIPLTGATGKVAASGNTKGTIIVVDAMVIQHGSYGEILTNRENDFAISDLFEAYGYWGMNNINGKGSENFVAVGYNVS